MILLRIYLGQYLNLLENDQSLCGGEISALIMEYFYETERFPSLEKFIFLGGDSILTSHFLIYYLKLTAKLLFVSKKILYNILLK